MFDSEIFYIFLSLSPAPVIRTENVPFESRNMASTTTLSSSQPSTSEPQLNVQYCVPGFCLPHPDTVNQFCRDQSNLIFCRGVIISTGVPVPKVFAYYTYGQIDRDAGDYGGLYDTYIFMSFVAGETLHTAWDTFGVSAKSHISRQLASYIQEIRDMGNIGYIGSIDHGPVTDHSLSTSIDKGPFDSEQDFNTALINAYQKNAPKRHIRSFLSGMLPQSHRILFTHGDIRPQNVMVKDGNVVAIIDWELSGWYPEYWEFAEALLTWGWQSDWTDYLTQILQPYHAEFFMHSFLIEKLLI
ncbi:hypothetical protein N7445_007872 [Penicillium cf. griseofulvum]|nr:hypothetical protein N7445_007872 [Penicillium cf. griseofulvum]